ncbi:hypothetical protein QBC35DRAFT_214820 [Podospora australis]|uniref:Conidiation-specific protein 6 n=1 Tax=Podospora australis TaxID=1536484 RepID=A0AAN6WXQ6_9PEZI|nr:hypothetical protein QBC35DRAFT_214820 [Podospora australis]
MPNAAQVAAGHKANLHNPNTSKESKENSKNILDEMMNDDDIPKDSENENKNPGNVAGGLKAALKNPNVSDEAKKSAEERLNQMS